MQGVVVFFIPSTSSGTVTLEEIIKIISKGPLK